MITLPVEKMRMFQALLLQKSIVPKVVSTSDKEKVEKEKNGGEGDK